MLGIPETTFRRKMKQIKARSLIGPMPRTPEWRELDDVFNGIVRRMRTDKTTWCEAGISSSPMFFIALEIKSACPLH